jgi:hypothetical protein
MTNNPTKIHAVSSSGVEIWERLSADVPLGKHSAPYVATKRARLGHLFGPGLSLHVLSAGEMKQFPDPETHSPQPGTAPAIAAHRDLLRQEIT